MCINLQHKKGVLDDIINNAKTKFDVSADAVIKNLIKGEMWYIDGRSPGHPIYIEKC